MAQHMTEAEVSISSNFAAVLRKIGDGEEVAVDRNGKPLAIIKPAEQEPLTLSDLIALTGQREKERGFAITLDEDFAADMEQIVRERKPWTPRSWSNCRHQHTGER
jgi:antitoxin (DNA-binding transcriptional repressor) of toxin-antitoxin stability system